MGVGPPSEPNENGDLRRLESVRPGGRRSLVLTLGEVATILQVDVRTVRKLIKIQRDEDTAAQAAGRTPRTVGLRVLQVSARLTRVTEQALGDYLQPSRDNSGH